MNEIPRLITSQKLHSTSQCVFLSRSLENRLFHFWWYNTNLHFAFHLSEVYTALRSIMLHSFTQWAANKELYMKQLKIFEAFCRLSFFLFGKNMTCPYVCWLMDWMILRYMLNTGNVQLFWEGNKNVCNRSNGFDFY